ncbi:GGDEF domain-containing protein [Bacillus shivajii]|uniref:GGDEF domain-containing protein n=1 Tax=Bacillus shivajii TaxID=1983719 RepID=UPI001CFA60EA|nr:GGDEF domain-containing protein [Bacillus shivajii]UCZ53764.1 GGDEF domain-containing protein [Bacillus shivajii]
MAIRSFLYKNETFSTLKRRIYLVLLPVLVFAFSTVLISLYIINGSLSFINIFTFSILCLGFTICFIILLINKHSQLYIEISFCIIASLLYLLRMYDHIITYLGQNGNYYLGTVAYWVPLLFLIFFFTFRGKVALKISITVYLLSFLPGVYHLLYSPFVNGQTFDTLLQFYIVTLAYIIALYFVQYVFEVFLQVDMAKHLANTDYLTGLPNRRKVDEFLDKELEVARSTEQPLSVILFDVDDFKKINDTYGHDAGDSVLKELSSLIKNHLPECTYFGRWGGEEFLVLFSGKNKEAGLKLAETLRHLIAKHEYSEIGQITSSFGVSEFIENDLKKDIVNRADEALYVAKKSGKNQVC